MSRINQLQTYRKHLEDRYSKLLEKSNDYKYIDESKSDFAAFKAMKILDKINRVSYLDREVLHSLS
ncbi:Lacal_2735 family protein [Polaribacter cellanae]|uniref:Lacal_2735 family protein n=1 Tax=Polaribacter cellanae TaxID=2818493 RepID=A0A975CQQ9_9FLAO|nr:Lacal_2735 family protein [Polaribacter cellanae]QTE23764.1 Lacal_2735 family protein [Polaribacter cellanae]